jgi:diguanylate cyclase (GGDEF)-like protein
VGSLLIWASLFTVSFLEISSNIQWMKKVFALLYVLGGLSIFFGGLGWHTAGFMVSHAGGLLLPVVCMAAVIIRIRQGFEPAWYYFVAWVCQLICGFAFALMGLKLLPVNFFTVNSMILGMAVDALLLSLALASRIRNLEMEKEHYRKEKQQYRHLSMTDGLTSLFNKRYLIWKLEQEVAHAHGRDLPLSLVMMDLDNFKAVNDTHGHLVGDQVLETLGRMIKKYIRKRDIACRFGGEEFVVIMPDTMVEDALSVSERIREGFFKKEFEVGRDAAIRVSLSLGVTALRQEETMERFLIRVDQALYQAKHQGKNKTVIIV